MLDLAKFYGHVMFVVAKKFAMIVDGGVDALIYYAP
jgi:hypothetical protein